MSEMRSLQAHDNKTKIASICTTIQLHYEQGDRIQILVSNEQAATYIDELLWKYQPESFLPHERSEHPSNERVVITITPENLNKANILLNLSQRPIKDAASYSIIYELATG